MPEEGPQAAEQVTSPAADEGRSGEDSRRRGWFWHWNTIITQYAPLIGLKGVGLLNSYTVWTDRREESPHRGYAFPSQQAEADFYGEDRAELITINKILVALDLIEIRKEMVLRVDERGRRWRVPHNLYRVKDHPDGYILGPDDVLRVVELAARDRAVYRYIRRIFSSRFAPIDRDNVWHQILPIVRQSATWQRLAARAEREEARNSARTRAGHASRSRAAGREEETAALPAGDPSAPTTDGDPTNSGSATSVDDSNTGSPVDVADSNDAFAAPRGSSDGETNNGQGETVDESNTTYHQDHSTTRTTTGSPAALADTPGADDDAALPRPAGNGPMLEPSPSVVACFEAANGRPATPLERELLAELAVAFGGAARRAGTTGDAWVEAAIREAVSSGSRFVAPKRIREILNRWSREADPVRPGAPPTAPVATASDAPDFPLPHGHGSRRTWEVVLRLLGQVIDRAELERLFAGSAIVGYRAGTVTVAVASPAIAERLGAEYYDLVARKLAEAMRRPVRVQFTAPADAEAAGAGSAEPVAPPAAPAEPPAAAAPPAPAAPAGEPLAIPRFVLPGGLTNRQVWAAAQDDLARELSQANYEAWVRPAALIGIDEDGALVLGAPSAFARRRLEQLLPQVRAALEGILGRPVEVQVVVTREWLRQRSGAGE
ncbi:MAG: DnaA N-terminal domain-containing protein [Sphaerobacter sp.]|nr:DnaA N-terminal domain-containing protein [Sphaerobacter sp.]